jgi:flagellar biosynthesis protein FlhG
MSDQADSLRALVRGQRSPTQPRRPNAGTTTLWFAGAKGGVGTSNLVLNLGVMLAKLNQNVLLIDANSDNPNLKSLAGLANHAEIYCAHDPHQTVRMISEAGQAPAAASYDFILIDVGGCAGLSQYCGHGEPDEIVVVTTPEPIAMSRAAIAVNKLLREGRRARVVFSQVASVFEARECLEALAESVGVAAGLLDNGHVRTDDCVRHAVRTAVPLVVGHPHCAASRSLRKLARRIASGKTKGVKSEQDVMTIA